MVILRRVSDGSRVRLGPELGRGGEGAVFSVISPVIGRESEPRVAKIYLKAPTPAKVEKLRVMARAATPALLRVAAWPIDLLMDENRRVRGFLMPRVAAREDAHELYSPKSRRRAFPDADFRFIVRAAANVARAFAQVHAAGHVIGDVNHGNALIGQDAHRRAHRLRFLPGSRSRADACSPATWACRCSPRRNCRTSAFAASGARCATMHSAWRCCCSTCCIPGRHPFAGRYVDGEMPIERAIAESRFAYGALRQSRGMSAPPGDADARGPGCGHCRVVRARVRGAGGRAAAGGDRVDRRTPAPRAAADGLRRFDPPIFTLGARPVAGAPSKAGRDFASSGRPRSLKSSTKSLSNPCGRPSRQCASRRVIRFFPPRSVRRPGRGRDGPFRTENNRMVEG